MAKPIQALRALRAAYEGDFESMADALTGRGVKQAANRADNLGRGTLTCAVAGRSGDEKSAQCVKMLLSAGADVNMVDKHNQSALHFAARFVRPLCAIALIDAGADVDLCIESGMLPIHLAIIGSSPQLINALIRAGADIESEGKPGQTPLQYAKEIAEKIEGPSIMERRREILGLLELHLSTGPGQSGKKKISL